MRSFHDNDAILIHAFCLYELNQFPDFKRIPVKDYVNRIDDLIQENPCNFFELHSITNAGCTDAVLKVTPKGEWFNPSRGDYLVSLPPRPHDKFKGTYRKDI